MLYKNLFALCLLGGATILIQSAAAIPKYEGNSNSNFFPKTDRDGDSHTHWRSSSYYNENKTQQKTEQDTASTKDRLQRLGYTTGYGTLNGYGGTGLSAYNPVKLDLGGVVLGTLVGIGAIIIIPKLIHLFHGGYAGYGRSEDGADLSTLSSMLNKVDDILAQSNIDSTNCMQRGVCSYVRSTEYNLRLGTPDQMDDFVHMLADNSLVDYLLDGTAIKEALEHGKNMSGKPCDEVYRSCPLDSKTAANVLMKLLPRKNDEQKSKQ